MNRIRSYNIGAALVALLLLASVAVACGDDEQTQASRGAPSQQVAPDEPQSTARSVEASDQAADQRDDSGASESAQQSRAEVRQDAQQDDEAQTAADQPEQAARDESESEAEPAPVTLGLRPILGGHQFHQPIEMLELPDGSFLVAEQRGYITPFRRKTTARLSNSASST